MAADARLKERQSFWETPRNIAILLGAVAALFATVAGLAGYKAGQNAGPPTIVFQPGAIVLQQPSPPQK